MSKVKPVKKTTQTVQAQAPTRVAVAEVFPFVQRNYILMGVGLLLLAIGYGLLYLQDFIDATKFSIALHVAPVVIIAGYVELIYAILARPRKSAA